MKLRFYQYEHYPFHITGKCEQEYWPELPMDVVWSALTNHLEVLARYSRVITHSCVLMSNHFHVLLTPPEPTCPEEVYGLFEMMNDTFAQFVGLDDVISRIGIKHISHIKHYQEAYRYVYRNPVEAGLVPRAEDYPFSSLQTVLGASNGGPICFDNMNLVNNPARTLSWLNGSEDEAVPYLH